MNVRKSKGVLEVEAWYDDTTRCCVCGDDIDEGDEFVWEPSPHIAPNACETAHPGCSVKNGWEVKR